ncbi:hypothetical protein IE81DRAFT_155452 [Ceraceosorus guamensis]|uniref:Uncharacterized protein n=1 Tax=Ceraceosorus guamensis TaxID=1522189 RepID=A0A316VWY9_9BASI|nr:hypothetical protein IE81DRAFT_155452 [Ceraceosorus guamensis]PWN41824.1 hypothetical protein IE81DRAFT_155452 [Ceraceosorus guamensis]
MRSSGPSTRTTAVGVRASAVVATATGPAAASASASTAVGRPVSGPFTIVLCENLRRRPNTFEENALVRRRLFGEAVDCRNRSVAADVYFPHPLQRRAKSRPWHTLRVRHDQARQLLGLGRV